LTLLENISANNGWAMAATGAIIVMIGLALLATIISQLHRIIAFFDRGGDKNTLSMSKPMTSMASAPIDLLDDPAAAASVYRPLTADLGDKFKLSKLYALMKQENNAHPHLTIRSLRDAGHLVKVDDDLFCWKTQ
jgi:hypothetical protein